MTRSIGRPQGRGEYIGQESLYGKDIRPDELERGDQLAMKIVAVVPLHGVMWWACEGPVHHDDSYIKEWGNKISEEAANALFPQFRAAGWVYRP